MLNISGYHHNTDLLSGSTLLEHTACTAPVGILVAEHRVVRFCNQAFSAMFGFHPEQLLERSTDRLYPSMAEFERAGSLAVTCPLQ